MHNTKLIIANLNKSFGSKQILKDLNFSVESGDFLSILGPSGCGKTTLLRIIGGFEECSNGEVLFEGENIVGLPPYKRKINTVFQKYALFPHMNVEENIAFGLNIKKMDKQVIKETVKEKRVKLLFLYLFIPVLVVNNHISKEYSYCPQ